LIEAGVIIGLYIGLLREYDSSLYMRVWLQANLPVATLFLNDNVFLPNGRNSNSVCYVPVGRQKTAIASIQLTDLEGGN